jgi:hypothetical protein
MQTFLLPDVLEDLRSPANLRYQARSLLAQMDKRGIGTLSFVRASSEPVMGLMRRNSMGSIRDAALILGSTKWATAFKFQPNVLSNIVFYQVVWTEAKELLPPITNTEFELSLTSDAYDGDLYWGWTSLGKPPGLFVPHFRICLSLVAWVFLSETLWWFLTSATVTPAMLNAQFESEAATVGGLSLGQYDWRGPFLLPIQLARFFKLRSSNKCFFCGSSSISDIKLFHALHSVQSRSTRRLN